MTPSLDAYEYLLKHIYNPRLFVKGLLRGTEKIEAEEEPRISNVSIHDRVA